jgi:hypothetical protein
MNIDLQEIINVLGGEAAFLAAAAWLIKSLVSHRMTQEAERFKVKLESDADKEIVRLRNALEMAALEHKVRFSKLHEKQADVIESLYKSLVETFWSALEYASQGIRDERKEHLNREQVFDLYRFIQLNKLYLPSPIFSLLDKFVGTLRLVVQRLPALHTSVQPTTLQMAMDQDHVFSASWKALEEGLPQLLRSLETEFQEILGVENHRAD